MDNNTQITVAQKKAAVLARVKSAMPTTLLESRMMTEQQAVIAGTKCAEHEMTASQARLAVVASALDDKKEEDQKMLADYMRAVRSVQDKKEEGKYVSPEDEANSIEGQDAVKSLPMRKAMNMIVSNPKATEKAHSLVRVLAVASTASDIIAYAKMGMGMHVDDAHPKYSGMVAELENLLSTKYGALSPKETLEAMRDYNERTSSKRQIGQYTPFSLSYVYAALDEYLVKRNRLLSAVQSEEQRQHQADEEEKKEKEEKLYTAAVSVYQQQLKTATANSRFGSGYVLDEFILRMLNEGIIQLSADERDFLKGYAKDVMNADLLSYEKIVQEKQQKGKGAQQIDAAKAAAQPTDQRTGGTSLLNSDYLASGLSTLNFDLWIQTPYYRNKYSEYRKEGMSGYDADRRALYLVYALKCAYYYTIRRAGLANDAAQKAAREATLQQNIRNAQKPKADDAAKI